MSGNIYKKGLVVIIIILFLGLSIQPVFAVQPNKSIIKNTTNENDLIEVTTQAYGINRFGNITVKLTRQQYQNLEQYMIEFRAQLNQTTTREEAVPIFKDAVVELNNYGLLPTGMSVEQAQNLVLSGIRKELHSNSLEKTFLKASNSLGLNQSRNLLCLIAGESTNTFFQTLSNTILISSIDLFIMSPIRIIWAFCLTTYLIFNYYLGFPLPLISAIFIITSDLIESITEYYINLTTNSGSSTFDIIRYSPYVIQGQYQSKGWINTFGLMGNQTINGTLIGRFPSLPIQNFFQFLGNPGVIGFTGIRLNVNQTSHKSSYIGSALMVAVDSTTP